MPGWLYEAFRLAFLTCVGTAVVLLILAIQSCAQRSPHMDWRGLLEDLDADQARQERARRALAHVALSLPESQEEWSSRLAAHLSVEDAP
ncbi:MAG: hypothetical protein U1E62_05500 [Alsobacter sp.]